jgi:fructoselysine 3-epimerase
VKVSFNLWPFCSFPVWLPATPFEDAIERLARIGYDGVEVCAAAPHAWPPYLTPARRREMRSVLDHHALGVSTICPAIGGGPGLNPASDFEPERKAAVQHYRDCIDLAVDLGAPALLYVAGWRIHGTSGERAWNQALTSMTEVARYGLERGVDLAVEPTSADTNLLDTAEDVLQMTAECGLASAKYMFDTYHTQFRRDVAPDYARTLRERLIHMHISDYDRGAPGQAGYDFQPLIDELVRQGYQGYLCVECGIGTRDVDPESIARQGLEYIRGTVAEAHRKIAGAA